MISVIGGGPSGSHLAYLLAKKGLKVSVFEEHDNIGKPVQCTGLVTSSIKELFPMKEEFVINKISKVVVISPDDTSVDFYLNSPNYVLDRRKFDEAVAKSAQDAGAKYYLKKKFTGFKDNTIFFGDGSSVKTDYLIGADGPLSAVAKQCGMFGNRKFMAGMQARVRGNFDSSTFVVYLGKGYFGWSVPENDRFSRVGVIASLGKPKPYFDLVLKKVNCTVVEYQSGLIPVYLPRIRCQKDGVFLIGDAATQCKASTHGGIIQGMIAGTALCEAIITGKSYDRLWRKKLGRDLYVHLKIRKMIDRMSDSDLNYMTKLVKQEKIKKILETCDRDFASKLALKILLKELRFLKLVF